MTLIHIALETFFVLVGLFAFWAIFDTLKQTWSYIKEIING